MTRPLVRRGFGSGVIVMGVAFKDVTTAKQAVGRALYQYSDQAVAIRLRLCRALSELEALGA